ncbi:MAG: GDSL-type esterase/lipase family protein [Planctomycetes bacterium]|nr:GDSL-type esterase/lipase family protein [Planctomycetota bacterium]
MSIIRPLSRRLGAWLLLLAAVCSGAAAEPATAARIKVACVGDSITLGNTKAPETAYPVLLQALLGERYEVVNFGVGGRTLLRRKDPLALGRALKAQPDVVVIMLGTNDARQATWDQLGGEFVGDYVGVVKAFQDLPSRPAVLAALPVPAFPGQWGISQTVIAGQVIPAIREAAEKAGIPVIDTHTPLLERKALFPDQVHPNPAGNQIIAETVAQAVRAAGR